jgi:extradiol dioxygenase family protein
MRRVRFTPTRSALLTADLHRREGFRFFGHQLSLHQGELFANDTTGEVGDHMVPMPHFGIVLPLGEWCELADRVVGLDTTYFIAPSVRVEGEPREQWTMFFATRRAIRLKSKTLLRPQVCSRASQSA